MSFQPFPAFFVRERGSIPRLLDTNDVDTVQINVFVLLKPCCECVSHSLDSPLAHSVMKSCELNASAAHCMSPSLYSTGAGAAEGTLLEEGAEELGFFLACICPPPPPPPPPPLFELPSGLSLIDFQVEELRFATFPVGSMRKPRASLSCKREREGGGSGGQRVTVQNTRTHMCVCFTLSLSLSLARSLSVPQQAAARIFSSHDRIGTGSHLHGNKQNKKPTVVSTQTNKHSERERERETHTHTHLCLHRICSFSPRGACTLVFVARSTRCRPPERQKEREIKEREGERERGKKRWDMETQEKSETLQMKLQRAG